MQFASLESSTPSENPSESWQPQPDGFPAWEGTLLQRSTEGLPLTKLSDRFTVRLLPDRTLDHLGLDHLGIIAPELRSRSLGGLDLVELQVDPAQLDQAMETVRQSGAAAFASHVYQMQDTPIYVTNQLTVQFAPTVTSDQMQAIASSFGLRVLKLVPGVAKAFAFEVTAQATANPIKLANRLLHCPEVLMAEPNIAVAIAWKASSQEAARAPWQAYSPQLGLEAAWNLTRGTRSIAIAVTGTAIDWHHPILQGIGKVVAPLPEAIPLQEGAGNTIPSFPSYLLLPIELAPECACMPLLIGDWLDDQGMEQWFEWATGQGAAVIHCGWAACTSYFPLSLRQRAAMTRAATQGRKGKGCVVIMAAGDRNSPIAGSNLLNGLALHPDVMTVTACTADHQKAPLSNWGTGVSVCAVGQTTGEASAMVAGIAALMLSVNPNLTARAVKHLLQDTADRILAPQPEGQRKPDVAGSYDGRGHSPWFGYGQANACEAIRAAQLQQVQSTDHVDQIDRWIQQQNFIPVEIPDCDPVGVVSAIDIAERAVIQDIQVAVELEHSFMGDLTLTLISPQGDELLLQSRTLGRLTQMNKTYTPENTPALKLALHHATEGRWQLKLVDSVRLHIGRLKRWELRLGV